LPLFIDVVYQLTISGFWIWRRQNGVGNERGKERKGKRREWKKEGKVDGTWKVDYLRRGG